MIPTRVAAYAAGLIDGEGCIYVRPRDFHLMLNIGMTKPGLGALEMMQRTFGGRLRMDRPATDVWEERYQWRQYADGIVPTLRCVLPFLRVKRRQADLAIEIAGLLPGRGRRWDPENRMRVHDCAEELSLLNKKGPK